VLDSQYSVYELYTSEAAGLYKLVRRAHEVRVCTKLVRAQ